MEVNETFWLDDGSTYINTRVFIDGSPKVIVVVVSLGVFLIRENRVEQLLIFDAHQGF